MRLPRISVSRQTCKYRDRIAREEQRSSRGPVAPFSRVVRPQRRCCLRGNSFHGSSLEASAHRRRTALPTCFQHRLPCFDGVVPQHPSTGLRDWIVRRSPVKRPQDHPLGRRRRHIGFELNNLVLIGVHKPTLTPCTNRLIVVIGSVSGHR